MKRFIKVLIVLPIQFIIILFFLVLSFILLLESMVMLHESFLLSLLSILCLLVVSYTGGFLLKKLEMGRYFGHDSLEPLLSGCYEGINFLIKRYVLKNQLPWKEYREKRSSL